MKTLLANWRKALREVLESALAAGIAFWIGQQLFGAEHTPLFAAIAAVICLSRGLPSHSKQALGMLFGVLAGIAVGEAALALAPGAGGVEIAVAVFVAMMAAVAFKVQPIIGIQAGVSTIIVLVEGATESSFARLADASIGGGVALLFSQVLLTPDPFGVIRDGARDMLAQARDLRERFDGCRLEGGDKQELRELLAQLRDAERSFVERLEYADQIAGRTLRGRLRRDAIETATDDWRTRARELHLALGTLGYTLEHSDGEDAACKEHLEEADRLIDRAEAEIEA